MKITILLFTVLTLSWAIPRAANWNPRDGKGLKRGVKRAIEPRRKATKTLPREPVVRNTGRFLKDSKPAAKKAVTHVSKIKAPASRFNKAATPLKKAVTPAKKAATPLKNAAIPSKKAVTPARKVITPARKVITPAKRSPPIMKPVGQVKKTPIVPKETTADTKEKLKAAMEYMKAQGPVNQSGDKRIEDLLASPSEAKNARPFDRAEFEQARAKIEEEEEQKREAEARALTSGCGRASIPLSAVIVFGISFLLIT